jgi:hypothetical protein
MTPRPITVRLYPDDVLFFLHIPKTGGITLTSILDTQFSRWEIFPFRHSGASPERFETFSSARLAGYRLVRGHYQFGPYDDRIWKHIVQNPICITMLRDPVRLTISYYRHILRDRTHPMHEEVTSQKLSLEAYVCDSRHFERVVNSQVHRVVGSVKGQPQGYNDPNALCDEALLVLAKQRLDQFAFVGLTERFRESVDLLTYTFGWSPVAEIPVLNAAPDPSTPEAIPPAALDAITQRTRLDAQLYAYATKLFEARLNRMNEELAHSHERHGGQPASY